MYTKVYFKMQDISSQTTYLLLRPGGKLHQLEVSWVYVAVILDLINILEVNLSTAQALTIQQAKKLIKSGTFRKIELSFNIDSDEFFNFVTEFCSAGVKITKKDDHFIVIIPKLMVSSQDSD